MPKNKTTKQVRIDATLHRKVKLYAYKNGLSVTYVVEGVVKQLLDNLKNSKHEL